MLDPKHLKKLAAGAPLVVVDVGAARGIHPKWRSFLPHVTVIGFEPDERSFRELEQTENVKYVQSALHREKGDQVFHLCRKPTNSSIYPPNREWLAQFPDPERFDVLETVPMACVSLEDALSGIAVDRMDFIKLDTQGSELDILEGAGPFLDDCIGIEVEVEFSPLYRGARLFHEVDAFLHDKGFELFDLRRVFWGRKEGVPARQRKGQLTYGDALYFRPPGWARSPEQRSRQAALFLAYSYADAALHCAEGDPSLGKLLRPLALDASRTQASAGYEPPGKFKDGALGGVPE